MSKEITAAPAAPGATQMTRQERKPKTPAPGEFYCDPNSNGEPFSLKPHLRTYFFKVDIRERKGEREKKKKHRCERETLISCLTHMPGPGIKPANEVCAL